MAVTPGTYNMTIQRRSDHSVQLVFKDSNSATKYADCTIAYTNRSTGTIDMSLTDTQTATFSPSLLKYDVLLTNPSGLKEYYLEGDIFMQEGYTA